MTKLNVFCSSLENLPKTCLFTGVFPEGLPIPIRSRGITCENYNTVWKLQTWPLDVFFQYWFSKQLETYIGVKAVNTGPDTVVTPVNKTIRETQVWLQEHSYFIV